MVDQYHLSNDRFLSYAPADASTTGFAASVSGASWTLTLTAATDSLAHQVSITNLTANNKSAIDITVVGTDQNGNALSETITGPTGSATVETAGYFLTVTSVTPASTWGADTASIGWVDEFSTPWLNVNYTAEDVLAIYADIGGTINYTIQQTFDDLQSATAPRWLAIASSQTADGLWNSTGGATALRLLVNSYSSGATLKLNLNPTAVANASLGGSGGLGTAVTIADGADVAFGTTTDAAYNGVTPLTGMGYLRAIANAAISTSATPVAGDTANDAVDAGNPVKIGGVAAATSLPSVASGDRANALTTVTGMLYASIAGVAAAGADTGSNAQVIYPSSNLGSQNPATGRTGLAIVNQNFDGTQWIRTRSNTVANGGAALAELGPYSRGRVTADGQIKASAGFIHTISIAPLTATPTAGLLTVYDSTTETGTVVYAEWIFATTPGHTVTLDIPCATGIYVGFDGTLANVQVTVAYR